MAKRNNNELRIVRRRKKQSLAIINSCLRGQMSDKHLKLIFHTYGPRKWKRGSGDQSCVIKPSFPSAISEKITLKIAQQKSIRDA